MTHSNKKRVRDIAMSTKKSTETNDDKNSETWRGKISDVRLGITTANGEVKSDMIDMYNCQGKEQDEKSKIKGLEGDMLYFNNQLETANDAVFLSTDPPLYHKFENMVIFRSGNLYSLCSPGNQHYQKNIYFLI